MSNSGGNEEEHRKKTEALFNKIVTSAKKKIEETEKVATFPGATSSPLFCGANRQAASSPAARRAC